MNEVNIVDALTAALSFFSVLLGTTGIVVTIFLMFFALIIVICVIISICEWIWEKIRG